MPYVVLIEHDVWRVLKQESKPTYFTNMSFKVAMVLDIQDKDVYQLFDDDPLFQAKCTEKASEAYNDFVNAMKIGLRQAEFAIKKNDTKEERDKAKKSLEKTYETAKKQLEAKGYDLVIKEYEALLQAQYKSTKYKGTAAVKVVSTLAGIVIGVAGLASTPVTAGAGTVLGFVSLFRSCTALYKTVSDLCKDAETAQEELDKDLKKLQDGYKNKTKAAVKEAGKIIWNNVIGVGEMRTITSCDGKCTLIEEKLNNLDTNAHSLAVVLNGVLKKCDIAKKSGKKDAVAKVTKLETETGKLITKIVSFQERCKSGKAKLAPLAKVVKDLNDKKPAALALLEKGLLLTDLALTAAAADWSNTSDTLLAFAQTVEDGLVQTA